MNNRASSLFTSKKHKVEIMKKFTTDAHFHIGQAHLTGGMVCQDYALSGICGTAAYAVVSDGCSTGGNTDVGARILALATAKAICEYWHTRQLISCETTPLEIGVHQQVILSGARDMLGLVQSDMLATCLFACVCPGGGLVHVKGDGVVAHTLTNGSLRMIRFEWANNAPLYPAYGSDHYAEFVRFHGGDLTATKLTKEVWEYDADGAFTKIGSEDISLGAGIRGVTIPVETSQLDCVAVFSDGVTQVDGMDWKDVVVDLLAFKMKAGRFAARRMARVIKEVEKIGKGPLDDIAYAVVLGESMSEEE